MVYANEVLTSAALTEATRRARAAAHAGDLEALTQALSDRQAALSQASPSEWAAALDQGEVIRRMLTEINRNIAAEHNQLEQLREGFASARAASAIDLHG